ncbi:MAG: hypothetical protein GY892_06460 [Shimia sp.]|nr:hypothetical protein [Shimia sp.]
MSAPVTKFIAAELNEADQVRFAHACQTAGLRVPSDWQKQQMEAAMTGKTVPDVMEQFDACSFSRAVQGLDQVVARPDTVFVSADRHLPNWRNRFPDEQAIIPLTALPDALAEQSAVQSLTPKVDRLAFVIPVAHPNGEKINNYNSVERILKQTVRSCLSQSHADVVVIVLCHRTPSWVSEFDDRLVVVNLGDGPEWTTGTPDVREDKGKKHLLGAQLAIKHYQASAVMFLDGDDFVRHDFAKTVLGKMTGATEGLVITRGVHAALNAQDNGFGLNLALKIDGFHHSCGSCRVFKAPVLADRMLRWWPAFMTVDLGLGQKNPDQAAMDAFFQRTKQSHDNEFGLLRILGRHRAKSMAAELTPLAMPLVVKGCGHGNHDGPRHGDVHWHRATGMADLNDIMTLFSLDPAGFHPKAQQPFHWRVLLAAPYNRLKRLF